MITKVISVLLAITLAVAAWLYIDRQKVELDAQKATIEQQVSQLKDSESALNAEREWSKNREDVLKAVRDISMDVESMRTTINNQERANRKAFQELLKNDKEVRDYISQPVPRSLGVLYERTETTDPANYGPGRSVPTDTVRTAGSTSSSNK